MTAEGTQIGLGYTSGMRFVGIKPPLTEDETESLAAMGIVRLEQLEQIDEEPACTLVRYSNAIRFGEQASSRALESAALIAAFLRPLRGEVNVDTAIVPLMGHQSSPFNPNTDL